MLLKLKALPGDDIHDSARMAWMVALKLGIKVYFEFNGVELYVSDSHKSPSEIVEQYQRALKRTEK